MDLIRNYIGQELTWEATKLMKEQFELYGGESVLATLDVSNWSSKATATAAEGTLEITRRGLAGQLFEVYPAGSENPLAVFNEGWTGGGTLQMADGRTYKWKNTSMLGNQRAWYDAEENELIYCKSHMLSRSVTVLVDLLASKIPELSMLVILGIYLIVIVNRDITMMGGV